jgi:hypothetical protein
MIQVPRILQLSTKASSLDLHLHGALDAGSANIPEKVVLDI